MNTKYTHKDILVWVKQFTLLSVFMAAGLTAFAQTPEYATFSGGLSGTGNFICSDMPDFTYAVTGDIAPGDTSIPGEAQIVDNNGGGMELIYGQADGEQNIQVEVAGYGGGNGGGIGDPITNTVTTTLEFDAPTPPNSLAFLVADIEQDQVTICAFDANGAPVSSAVIDSWFQSTFDADDSDPTSTPPTWDAASSTVVGEQGVGGVKQTNYVADLPDNEAGAAWFQVNIAISKLEFKFQAMGVNPDDPSYHLLVASTCGAPTCTDLLNDPQICDYIIDNPNSTIAQEDCDGGGISNLIECQTGENPSNPADDCMALMDAGLNICTIIAADPNSGLATQDCDGGGVDNATECADGKDPKDPSDDVDLNPCQAPIGCAPVPTLDVCTDGTTRTIGCDTGLENANVIWYNGMGVQVGTGCDLVLDNTMIQNGNIGDMMCFYYVAEDPANPGCSITSCCPIIAQVVSCGFYDLALVKKEISNGPYSPGDDVTYEITVCNQGSLDAANVQVTDLIPADMTLSTADGNGWVGPAVGPVNNTIASLPATVCETINIVLTIDSNFQGTSIINNALITSDDGDDIDSNPAIIDMLNDLADDDDFTETDGGDDEDPEEILVEQVYDLALIKEASANGPFDVGDDVPYTITVCNQGTLDAANVEITDYIPSGMRVSASDANGWVGPRLGPVKNTIASLPANTCTTLDILLRIRPAFTGTTLVNYAEISSDNGDDIDSTPDAINGNDAGGSPETASDDVQTGNGTGSPGDAIALTDEDDHDPELINVNQLYDLALIKEEASSGPYSPGDDVTYSITVCNQGTLAGANIEVTDYIPAGMTLSAADANGWAGPAVGPVTNTIASLPVGDCSILDIVLTIDAGFQGTTLVNFAEISADNGDDADSTPDATNGNDAGGNPTSPSDDEFDGNGTGAPGDSVAATDEDDHDPELISLIQVYDLALTKETAAPGPFAPGDDVPYTIEVCNQGTLDAANVQVTDYIPSGMTISLLDPNGWVGPDAGPVATSIASIAAGTCTTVDIILTIDAGFQGTTLVNFAEISADNGADIDSAPDAINGNDAGGNPDSPSDDVNTGNGTGVPGDSVAATDEDDHDPESISLVQVYDLALIKTTSAAGPFAAGDDVPYTIEVCNQGTLDAANVVVTDYIPASMTLSTNDANGWAGAAAGPVTNTIASLPAGVCSTVDIILTIDAGFQGTSLVNFAEISSDDGDDIDSAPDATNGNDAGGNPDSPSDDVFGGNGTGNPGDSVGATDEDDHDPESIVVDQNYDLALVKQTPAGATYAPGDNVPYTITICNQGTLDAANVEVTDYIPADMTLSTADANGWTGPAAGPVSTTIASIPAATCTTTTIILTIDPAFQGTSIVNFAEISADNGDDIDSAPDASNINDAGGNPDSPSDDVFSGNGTGTPGDTVAATDEDDHDPESIVVEQIYDLALIKEASAVGPFEAGDDVPYTIEVCNQGTLDAANIEITDYIPAGMTLSIGDANGWSGPAAGPVTNTIASLPVDACATVAIVLTIDAGFQGTSLVNFAEISADNGDDIDSTPDATNGNDAGGNPETPSDDEFDGNGTGNPGDSVAATDEDDHDPELISLVQIYDLALIKEASAVGPFAAGDDVPYTITVCNQGTLDAANIEVTDYIPTGLTLSAADANGWSGPAAGPVTTRIASLPAGACSTVDIILTIDAAFQGTRLVNFAEISTDNGDDVDSAPDATNGNDAGGNPESASDDEFDGNGTGAPGDSVAATDEDDHDPEAIEIEQVYDLALIKQVSAAGPFEAGDDVPYTIEVCNQGTLDAASIEVTDYIPSGMTLSAADANGWTVAGASATNTLASLPAGDCSTIDIILTIETDYQGTQLVNFAEISSDDGTDVDSSPDGINGNDAGGNPDTPSDDVNAGDGTGVPGDMIAATDEDDHDPEAIVVDQVYDLSLIKEASAAGPFATGADVPYTITVCNQGTLDAAIAEITDYIPAGMTLSAADANGWSGPAAGPVSNTITNLAAGACTTVDIILTIDADFMGDSLVNFAEISNDDGDDVDSTPDAIVGNDAGGAPETPSDNADDGNGTGAPGDPLAATDEDDHDPELIELIQTYDLALAKTEVSQGPYSAGDDVTYAIEVCNQGTLDAANIAITDYIPLEMALSAADANGWAGPIAGPVTNTVASLPAGDCSTVNIVLTIDPGFQGTSIVNYAEISADNGDDIDSTPDPINGNDAGGNPNSPSDDEVMGDGTGAPGDSVAATDEDDHDPEEITLVQEYDLALIKTESSAGPYFPGDDVTYTIEVCNQGTLDAAAVTVTDFIPSDMMLSAADANGWSGAAAGPVTNTIASLAAGACTALDITLTIDAGFAGGTIVNFAEISADDGDDIDSTPDPINGNDAGGAPDSPSDNVLFGDGTGAPGDPVGATDEDDHDPEAIVVEEVYDLALIKQVSSAGPFFPGDDVTYTITIENQGTAVANVFQITDYIPANMTLSAADANGWAGPAAGPVSNSVISPLAPGASTTLDIVLTIDPNFGGGPLVNFAEISFDDGDDVDSTPDAMNGNDAGGNPESASDDVNAGDGTGMPGDSVPGTDEDDHDPEQIMVEMIYDLALIKEVTSVGPYTPGDDVTYTITVENQGTLVANIFQITDYIPAGMTLSASDANGWAGPIAGPVTTNIITPLAPGASTTVDIVLTIDPNFTGDALVNFAEISFDDGDDIDSVADGMVGNDAGGNPDSPSDDVNTGDGTGAPGDMVAATDEDDHDPEAIVVDAIYDLALTKKESSAGPYFPGDDVTYAIEVCNQGTLAASNVSVTDYIPAEMTLSSADANGWVGPAAGPVTNTLSSVPVGTCQTVNIVLTINTSFTGVAIVNFAEISGDDGDDVDSTTDPINGNDAGGNPNSPSDDVITGDGTGIPNDMNPATDEDDHDPEEIEVGQIYDLALIKEVTSAGPYSSGDDVTYTITVTNQGSLPASVFQIADYIPAGMTLSANDTNGWAGPSAGPVTKNVIGNLAPGASTTVDITLTIDPTYAGGTLVNYAEISFDDGDDFDSTPDLINGNDAGGNPDSASDDVNGGDGTGIPGDSNPTTDEDDHDPEAIEACPASDAGIVAEGSKDDDLPAGGSVIRNAVATGQVVPESDSLVFILVDPAGNILQVDSIPEFVITEEGDYTIHPVVYNPLDCSVSLAGTVNDILASCNCVAIDLVGASISVKEQCLSNAGGLLNGLATGCADPGVSDATLTAVSVGLNIPAGSTVGYILTTGPASIILATSITPSFNVDTPETYAIHPIVYDPLTYSLAGIALGVDDIFSVNAAINAAGACANVDLLGLKVIAEACTGACPFDLYIPGAGVPVNPDVYEAQNDITSDGLITGGAVEYSAGNSVELLPGFEVTLGTEFEAYIEGCN